MNALPDNWLGLFGAVALLVVVASAADWLTNRVIRGAIRRVAARTKSTWDDRVIERRVFARIAHIVPAVIAYYGIGPALGISPTEILGSAGVLALSARFVQRVSLSFVVLTIAMAAAGFLDAVNDIYKESYAESKSRPIKG